MSQNFVLQFILKPHNISKMMNVDKDQQFPNSFIFYYLFPISTFDLCKELVKNICSFVIVLFLLECDWAI